MKKLLFYVLVASMSLGCANQKIHDGDLGKEQVSIISPAANVMSFRAPTVILNVDGKPMDQLVSGSFEVLPGEHHVRVGVFRLYRSPLFVTDIVFSTAPGKEYIVDYRDAGSGVSYIVNEKSSGKRIYEQGKRQ